jgi:hypothetical protein
MTNYLERYQQGEYEQVWRELLALGDLVQGTAPFSRVSLFYDEALAVARETMRRTRHNIEMLIPRLQTIGYIFGSTWLEAIVNQYVSGQQVKVPPEAHTLLTPGQIQLLEEYDPEQERDWFREIARRPALPWTPPSPEVADHLAEVEELFGPIPLSLRAWYEIVGAVDFVGQPPLAWEALHFKVPPVSSTEQRYNLDPLVVEPLEQGVRDARSQYQYKDQQPWIYLTVSPSEEAKYHVYGQDPHVIQIPNACVDALLPFEWHQTTFVNYLRICFRWGGLPGLERCPQVPVKDLAFLTEGLLPI